MSRWFVDTNSPQYMLDGARRGKQLFEKLFYVCEQPFTSNLLYDASFVEKMAHNIVLKEENISKSLLGFRYSCQYRFGQ